MKCLQNAGIAIGALSVNVPNYNAEVAPPEVRGSLVALQQLAIVAGIMVSFWIDYGTHYIGGTEKGQSEAAWLVPICLQLIPGLVLGIGMIFMPFSPRWLLHHGYEKEARQVLTSLRGLSDEHDLIELEFLEIKAQSTFEKRTLAEKWPHLVELKPWNIFKLQFVAIGSLFRTMPMFRRVIVATVTMFFQQFTGINAVNRPFFSNPVTMGSGLYHIEFSVQASEIGTTILTLRSRYRFSTTPPPFSPPSAPQATPHLS